MGGLSEAAAGAVPPGGGGRSGLGDTGVARIRRESLKGMPMPSTLIPLASRRAMLRAGSLAFFGFGLSDYLRLQAASGAKAQSVILVWLNGGPSHVDTWDPKPNSSFRAISTNVAGVQVSELLPRCARLMDKLSIVRSVHTEENNHGIAHHYA